MTESYRQAFQGEGDGGTYDALLFGNSSYGEILTEVECALLTRQIKRDFPKGVAASLDFACGTGRILRCVANLVKSAVGIEIAQPMIEVARDRVPTAEIRHQDISDEQGSPTDKFDLITSFRFFLHAEPALRDAVMGRLAARLRDADSRMIFNVHTSRASYNLLSATTRKLTFMSHSNVLRLIEKHGMEIADYRTYAFFSGASIRLLGFNRARRLERRLALREKALRFGSHRLYIVRLRKR